MNRLRIAAALSLSLTGAAVLAHNGATGLVMDRMMGMSAMREVVAKLAPMMQGAVPYDVRTVQENAARIMGHSGETMTALFPEGGDMTASFARPEIWEQWGEFEGLANELRLYAEGLATAAPNGLEAPAPVSMPMSSRMAAMVPDAEPPRLTVAQLMGVEPRTDATPVIVADAPNGGVDFAALAADDVFEMVGQTCSSCHALFRSGS